MKKKIAAWVGYLATITYLGWLYGELGFDKDIRAIMLCIQSVGFLCYSFYILVEAKSK